MEEPKFLTALQKYALVFGAGGFTALQVMKWDIFSFPDELKIYLGYFFSFVTVFCVFIAGPRLINEAQKGWANIRDLKEIKKQEEKKDETDR